MVIVNSAYKETQLLKTVPLSPKQTDVIHSFETYHNSSFVAQKD